MYQALYRKYRPRTFEDVVSQVNVKKILINSIKNNVVSHAYLFSGPRGIGKTSIAKIFAKAVNCTQFDSKNDACLECESCLEATEDTTDIIEIDAASNNGVDQIRELKSKVNIVPSKLKYKVYIIDEVHMLSNSAFNALLKTLEEPPSHVIFILATTEFYEVPETIVSRCQCFSFQRISNDDMSERLRYIANQENIKVPDEVLMEIAIYANGGMRDAISMLDKLSSFTNKNITMDDFISLNGLISHSDIKETYELLINKDAKGILKIIDKINQSGYDFNNFVERLMIYIKDIIVESYQSNEKIDIKRHVMLVNELNELLNVLKTTLNPLIMTQILLLNMVNGEEKNKSLNKIETESVIENKPFFQNKINEKNKESKVVNNKSTYSINEEIRLLRINNALAQANLSFKNTFVKNYQHISEYRLDEKFAKVAQLLEISTPLVVSDKNVIIGNNREAIVERLYENSEEVDNLLAIINNHPYKAVFVTEKEFENIKNKYINDKKNDIIYEYQEENAPLVIKEKKNNELVNKALSVFGSDLVDIEEE